MTSTHSYPFAKCHVCGWLHVAVPAADARAETADTNAGFEQAGEARRAKYESFLHCSRCRADSAKFLPAAESDAPSGVTLQSVVVER